MLKWYPHTDVINTGTDHKGLLTKNGGQGWFLKEDKLNEKLHWDSHCGLHHRRFLLPCAYIQIMKKIFLLGGGFQNRTALAFN